MVIAAGYWGKLKTVFQMVMICLLILNNGRFLPGNTLFEILTGVVTGIALVLTVVSLIDYIWKNKGVMTEEI